MAFRLLLYDVMPEKELDNHNIEGVEPVQDLGDLLDRLEAASQDKDQVSMEAILHEVGSSSFAVLLLMAGLIALSPLSGIPGVPTIVAGMVFVIVGQLLIRRRHFWLPNWLLQRSVSRENFDKAIRFLRPPSRWINQYFRPRLTFLTRHFALYAMALVCLAIAVTMPFLEILPFVATTAGAALSAFALAIIMQDGLLAIAALTATTTLGMITVKALF